IANANASDSICKYNTASDPTLPTLQAGRQSYRFLKRRPSVGLTTDYRLIACGRFPMTPLMGYERKYII
ncbi:hypothetical protein OSTOST_10397, partial [Ostertagia ostertagi]